MTDEIEKSEVGRVHAAIVDAGCLAMMIDGEIHEREIAHMRSFVAELLEVDEEVTELMIEDSKRRIEETKLEDFLDALPRRVPESGAQERLLFAVIIMEFVDGVFTMEEEGLVYAMASRFGIPEEHLESITYEAHQTYLHFIESDALD